MNAKQRKILNSALSFVAQDGWTQEAFVQGVKVSGVSLPEAEKLFPLGITDIADAFHQFINEAMQERIAAKRNFAGLHVREKVTFAVRARLEAIEPYREPMHRLLTWSLLPRNIRKSTNYLWQAADTVWIAAGDTSTDYNRYTKRLLLIAVMKSTLSFWLNDTSVDYSATWAFLDRRINDVMRIGKGINVVKTVGISDIATFVKARFKG